jgi:hypothetical protein
LIVVMVVTSFCIRKVGVVPILGFIVGVIVSGIVAFLNPMNPDVLGTRQIYNPNVIGNVLAVSVIFSSFVILNGYPVIGCLLAICASVIAFFTFSKGTWLMVIFALISCGLALNSLEVKNNVLHKYRKLLAYILLGSLLYGAYEFWDTVSLIVVAKIHATEFGATAAEGGSFSARAGLILSAIYMFLSNPLLGVGISNFEYINSLLEADLGDAYYDDDNPNSAWFYVLGGMGLPAFLLFSWIFYWFLGRVSRIAFLKPKARYLYTACVGLVFFIGGNVQLQMLSAYYYWVALGAVAALSTSPVRAKFSLPLNTPYQAGVR